jgi:hypothetical protein
MAKKTINIRAGFDLKAFSTSQQNLVRQLQASGRKMQSVGRSMSMSLTAPIVGLGAAATKTFATFEQSMAKVKAISGATGTAFKDLEGTARKLGMTTRFSASEVSELMLNYSKLGFSANEIQKITGATLDLALATGEDLAQSAEVAGSTLRAFGLEADQMQRVTDVMAKSFSSSALDLGRFSDSMKFVAPVAKSANISIEETTAMLGVLANNGIKGSQAGTALRRIISEIGATGKPVNQALKELAATGLNLADAKDEVGRSAQSALLVLSEGVDKIDPLTEALEGAEGAAAAMAGIMDDTLEGSMFKLQSAVSEMGISIGEKLAPHIIKVTNFLAKLAEGFSQLNPETQQIIIQLAATAAAIGPLIYAFGALKLAMAFLIAHPAVLVAIALASALAALNIAASETNKIFDNVKTATEAMQTAYDELGTAVDNLNRLKNQGLKASKDEIILAIQNAKAKLKEAEAYFKLNMQRRKELALQKKESLQQALAATQQVGKQGEFIGAELAQTKQIEANILAIDEKLAKLTEQSFSAKDGIKELEAQLKQIENLKPTENTFLGTTTGETKTPEKLLSPKEATKKISTLKAKINDIMKGFQPEIIPVVNVDKIEEGLNKPEVKSKLKKMGENLSQSFNQGLQSLVAKGVSDLGKFFGDTFTSGAMMSDQLKQTEDHYNKLIEAARQNGEDITKIEEEKAQKIAEIQKGFSMKSRVEDFGRGLLDAIGGFMTQFGEAMIAFGLKLKMMNVAIATNNPGLAIAAGIALVAAGTAISNLSKKGMGSETTGGSSPSPTGGGMGTMALQPISLETKISGRDLILVQNREKGFSR